MRSHRAVHRQPKGRARAEGSAPSVPAAQPASVNAQRQNYIFQTIEEYGEREMDRAVAQPIGKLILVKERFEVGKHRDGWCVFDSFTQEPVPEKSYKLKGDAIRACGAANRAYMDTL